MDTLFQIEHALLDVLLVGNIIPFTFRSKIPIVTHPLKKSVLTYFVTILRDYLRKFTNKAARLACFDSICKRNFWCLLFELLALNSDSGLCAFECPLFILYSSLQYLHRVQDSRIIVVHCRHTLCE